MANKLIRKQLKIHECIFTTVTTDTTVLKHQAIIVMKTYPLYRTSFIPKYCFYS